MPRSKHGPALFEVYGKGRTDDQTSAAEEKGSIVRRSPAGESASAVKAKLSSLAATIKGGFGGGDTGDAGVGAAGASATRDSAAPGDSDTLAAGTGVAGIDRASVARGAGVETPRPPMFAIEGGRIHIALTSRGAGVVGFALVFALFSVFAAGQWFGHEVGFADGRKEERASIQSAALDEIEEARNSRPVEGLFTGIGESPVEPATESSVAAARSAEERRRSVPLNAVPATSTSTSSTPWVKGNTYVVVQNFRSDARQDADRAKEFLAQHGVATEVVGAADKGFRLIATTGFNMKDPTQEKLAEQFLMKVRDIGKAYFKTGGRYKLEGFFATQTSDTW